jgi:broad specificity phosphatase PhoE
MTVQKTCRRQGKTMEHGAFEVKETVRVCAAKCRLPSGRLSTRRSRDVARSIMPNCVAGYDLMAFVGLKRFLECKQRDEIASELERTRGISVSTGEVSNLAARFLDYVSRLHRAKASALKAAMQSDGGWPMNVDATGENGRGTLFVVFSGWRNWVLGSWKISTERADLMLPCLRETVSRFGPPCAFMRDMGRAVTPAIDELAAEFDLRVPVLVCHQHFLSDVGKDLLNPGHSALRALFRQSKIQPELRKFVRETGRKIGADIDCARKAISQWKEEIDVSGTLPPGLRGLAVVRAVAQWTLDFKSDLTGLDFPFDRPYLALYDRCCDAMEATDAFALDSADDVEVGRLVEKLRKILSKLHCEASFAKTARALRRRAALFDRLRDRLRMAKKPPLEESENDLDSIRRSFDNWIETLKRSRPKRGLAKDVRQSLDIVFRHVEKHGENLWGHAIHLPEHAGGGKRMVSRTNEKIENFFGAIKHGERRRSGHKNLSHVLETMKPEAALARNLSKTDYVEIVCGSLENLPAAFRQLDEEDGAREDANIEIKENSEIEEILRLSSASLSNDDRKIVRCEKMNERVKNLAKAISRRKAA